MYTQAVLIVLNELSKNRHVVGRGHVRRICGKVEKGNGEWILLYFIACMCFVNSPLGLPFSDTAC